MTENKLDRGRITRRLVGWFILALFFTELAERIIQLLFNRCIMPWIASQMFVGISNQMQDLSSRNSFLLLLYLAAMVMFNLVRCIFPQYEQQMDTLINTLAYNAQLKKTGVYITGNTIHMSMGMAILILNLIIVLICLGIVPYVAAAWLYARMVIGQMALIRQHEKDIHTEYEKKRNLMLSDIAHDLRNPITTVSGYAKALNDGMVKDPEKQRKYFEAIERKSRRINELINLLFDYSKLNSSSFTLTKTNFDLNELMRETAALMYDEIEQHNMGLDVDIPEGDWMINGDRMQISRVVTNLITNAIRHNPEGTDVFVQVLRPKTGTEERVVSYEEVKMGLQPDEEEVVSYSPDDHSYIIVADTGVEIPEKIREHIFEPFMRGDESRATNGGSGLGLSIAATVVEMHGWKLTLETNIQGYTKGFVIMVP